jgi:hypothetical protein
MAWCMVDLLLLLLRCCCAASLHHLIPDPPGASRTSPWLRLRARAGKSSAVQAGTQWQAAL